LVVFYSVYPFIARLKTRRLLLLFVGISVVLHGLAIAYKPMNTTAYWYISPASRILDFLLGMITFRLYRKVLNQGGKQRWACLPVILRWGIELIPLGLYAVALCYLRSDFTDLKSVVLFYVPSCLVIFLFALASESGEKDGIPELLSKKWLIYLGQVSFSFYMVHNLVILSVKKGLEYFAPATPWELRLVISLVGAIVAGILVNRYFEAPVANRLSKLLPAKK
jgi:acyltransferase